MLTAVLSLQVMLSLAFVRAVPLDSLGDFVETWRGCVVKYLLSNTLFAFPCSRFFDWWGLVGRATNSGLSGRKRCRISETELQNLI